MKDKKWILTAVILSGGIGLGAPHILAQTEKGSRSLERSNSERQFEEKSEKQPSVSSGISDADIQNIKQALKDKGYNPGPMNGELDSKTQQAIREFQKSNNLPVTGSVDQQTATKLGITIGGANRARPRDSGMGSKSDAGSRSDSGVGSKGKGVAD